MSGFTSPIVGSAGRLIIEQVQSDNFVTGVSGWYIGKDGTAEFVGITVIGDVIADSFQTDVAPNPRIIIENTDKGTIQFLDGAGTDHSAAIFADKVSGFYYGRFEGWKPSGYAGTRPIMWLVAEDVGGSVLESTVTIEGDDVDYSAVGSGSATGQHVFMAKGNTSLVVSSNQIGAANGSAGAPSISFFSDLDTGLFRPGANTLGFVSGGSYHSYMTNADFLTTLAATFSAAIYGPGMTLATAGGLVVERLGTAPNELYAETSSGRGKYNVQKFDARYVERFLKCELKSWDAATIPPIGPPAPMEKKGENEGQVWNRPGFIVEEMMDVFPQAVVFDEHDNPIGVDRGLVIATLAFIVQKLVAHIDKSGNKIKWE